MMLKNLAIIFFMVNILPQTKEVKSNHDGIYIFKPELDDVYPITEASKNNSKWNIPVYIKKEVPKK